MLATFLSASPVLPFPPLDFGVTVIYDLVALFIGIVTGVSLIAPHHRMHVEMDDED